MVESGLVKDTIYPVLVIYMAFFAARSIKMVSHGFLTIQFGVNKYNDTVVLGYSSCGAQIT